MLMEQPVFTMGLAAVKNGKETVFEGEDCLVDFKKNGVDDLELLGWTNKKHSIYADLSDGSFIINGQRIKTDLGLVSEDEAGNTRAVREDELVYEPIWFRRVRKDFEMGGGVKTVCKYCIGWKTNPEGRVHQRIAILDEEGNVTLSDRR